MNKEDLAAAEMVGAIVLTSIVAVAIGIVGYQWLSQIPTSSPPSLNLEIACGNKNTAPLDFSCRSGVLNCDPAIDIRYNNCIKNCSQPGSLEYQKCKDNCGSTPNCIDVSSSAQCNMVFICHNGGDSLDISKLSVRIGDVKLDPPFTIYNYITNQTNSRAEGNFQAGDVIKISPIQNPLRRVLIIYNDYHSGQNQVLIDKQF